MKQFLGDMADFTLDQGEDEEVRRLDPEFEEDEGEYAEEELIDDGEDDDLDHEDED